MKIGVDGGGSKTELILVADSGELLARHLAPGCNPSITGPAEAGRILSHALDALITGHTSAIIRRTLLFMAGNREFWANTAAALSASARFGEVTAADDSLPVLELATAGAPGLVLHAGTGSFVAARAPDRTLHYAGGLGWRFGDPGSGYDLGRRAVARGLLELQGWATPTTLTALLLEHTGLTDASSITRHFYQHPEANRHIATLAKPILHLAATGDVGCRRLVFDSVEKLLALATDVARRLFPDADHATLPAGLSGPILTHPAVAAGIATFAPFTFNLIDAPPIDGIRRLLLRSSPA